jgi:hypothetical protein
MCPHTYDHVLLPVGARVAIGMDRPANGLLAQPAASGLRLMWSRGNVRAYITFPVTVAAVNLGTAREQTAYLGHVHLSSADAHLALLELLGGLGLPHNPGSAQSQYLHICTFAQHQPGVTWILAIRFSSSAACVC